LHLRSLTGSLRLDSSASVLRSNGALGSSVLSDNGARWRIGRCPSARGLLVHSRGQSSGELDIWVGHAGLDEEHADNEVGQIEGSSLLGVGKVPTCQLPSLRLLHSPDETKLVVAELTLDEDVPGLVSCDQAIMWPTSNEDPSKLCSVGGSKRR
jgi:hypothetical protein